MKTKKTGLTISAAELVVLTGLSDRQIRNISAKGFFPAPNHGVYEREATLVGLVKYYRQQSQRHTSAMAEARLAREIDHGRRERVLADLAEKAVCPIEELRRAWFSNVISAKRKFYDAENAIAVAVGLKLGLSNEHVNIIKEETMRQHRQALRELHLGEWGVTTCPQCQVELKPFP